MRGFGASRFLLFLLCTHVNIYGAVVPAEKDSCFQSDMTEIMEWKLADIVESLPKDWSVVGEPRITDSPYGKAVQFDGQGDACVLDSNPLVHLHQFTIEVILRPDTNGLHEQRFSHMGELRGDRVMLETRLTEDGYWYLDTYMKSSETGLTLKDSTILHPLNQWYHIAFVVENGKMEAFVNGERELEGQIPFSPFTTGKTSLGVRLNRVSWFKGSIYLVRITPLKLEPDKFIKP